MADVESLEASCPDTSPQVKEHCSVLIMSVGDVLGYVSKESIVHSEICLL